MERGPTSTEAATYGVSGPATSVVPSSSAHSSSVGDVTLEAIMV